MESGKITLEIRKDGILIPLSRKFKTYAAAVECGQELVGYGNFTVTTSHVPSRDEQLLNRTRSEEFLDSL